MRTMLDRAGWALAGALALAVLAIAAHEAQGGPLDPPGAPGSTLQSLGQMPPDWSQQLDATNGGGSGCSSTRFECVMLSVICNPNCHFQYDGVLDHETGLVWERDPGAKPGGVWTGSYDYCLGVNLGGRMGWRMATEPELLSLLDQTQVAPAVSLPAGHPFFNAGNTFWSSTQFPDDPSSAYVVYFVGIQPGVPGGKSSYLRNGSTVRGWCVRGADTQWRRSRATRVESGRRSRTLHACISRGGSSTASAAGASSH